MKLILYAVAAYVLIQYFNKPAPATKNGAQNGAIEGLTYDPGITGYDVWEQNTPLVGVPTNSDIGQAQFDPNAAVNSLYHRVAPGGRTYLTM